MITDFKSLVQFTIEGILSPVTKLILALAIVYFLWNTLQFIRNAGNEEARTQFKYQATWGIIAIAVMVSLWGLVAWFTHTFLGTGVFIPQIQVH